MNKIDIGNFISEYNIFFEEIYSIFRELNDKKALEYYCSLFDYIDFDYSDGKKITVRYSNLFGYSDTQTWIEIPTEILWDDEKKREFIEKQINKKTKVV